MTPGRTRYTLVWFAVVLAAIQYIDRVCISKAAGSIRADLEISKEMMGWVFGAFTAAYSLFEVPTGWMGDRFGARKTLVRVTLWWSFFTAATGWVKGLGSMIAVRFLFGAGEAGCFPNLTRAFSSWLRPGERVRAQSILWLCARWAGALTPLLVAWILTLVSWRASFQIFAVLGVVWSFFFWRWFRDDPRQHPGVGEAERTLLTENAPPAAGHSGVPWGRFLGAPTTWLLWAQYFCVSYVWYFYVTWLPPFIDELYPQMDLYLKGLLAGLPLFCGGFGCLVSGAVLPRLSRAIGVLKARRIMATGGFVGAALSVILAAYLVQTARSPYLVLGAFGLAGYFGDLAMPCSWGTCMDVGGRFSGTYSGAMNMMGNFGGVVSPIVAGYMTAGGGNWIRFFYICGGVLLIGAVAWAFVDPVRRLDRPEGDGPHVPPSPASA